MNSKLRFKCRICDTVNPVDNWNRSTSNVFGENIVKIEDLEQGKSSLSFICPSCENECMYHLGEVVKA